MDFTRRDLLTLSGSALAGTVLAPSTLRAQTPKRGGVLTLRVWDPPHFDPYLVIAFKTQVVYSFAHSRLLKHKAGPASWPRPATREAFPRWSISTASARPRSSTARSSSPGT